MKLRKRKQQATVSLLDTLTTLLTDDSLYNELVPFEIHACYSPWFDKTRGGEQNNRQQTQTLEARLDIGADGSRPLRNFLRNIYLAGKVLCHDRMHDALDCGGAEPSTQHVKW